MSVNIAMWSGPRNISTAMMYAFGSRADCIAWDEPFYAFSLVHRGNDHPMRDDIIKAGDANYASVAATCAAPATKSVFYQKHMTHHMPEGFDRSWMHRVTNAFLIRAPERVLASYARKWADVTLDATGFVQQLAIFNEVADQLGRAPPVIDADDILSAPEPVLRLLCSRLGIGFDPAMLSWPKGPKSFDGVWAPHWYNAAWQSTGFAAPAAEVAALPDPLKRIADDARPIYERLRAHRLVV
jgi:Sulfotransferase domain